MEGTCIVAREVIRDNREVVTMTLQVRYETTVSDLPLTAYRAERALEDRARTGRRSDPPPALSVEGVVAPSIVHGVALVEGR